VVVRAGTGVRRRGSQEANETSEDEDEGTGGGECAGIPVEMLFVHSVIWSVDMVVVLDEIWRNVEQTPG
jgi:hypothetical protein